MFHKVVCAKDRNKRNSLGIGGWGGQAMVTVLSRIMRKASGRRGHLSRVLQEGREGSLRD